MKRLTKRISICAFIMIFLSGVLLLSFGMSLASQETIRLKFASQYPPTHILTKIDKEWCKKIEKETNGRVKFDFYAGGTLLNPRKAWYELTQGVADVASVNTAMAQGFDITNAIGTFHYGSDVKALRKIMPKIYQKFQTFRDEMKENKIIIYSGIVPEYVVSSRKKPLRTIEDFKGLQYRPPATTPGLIEKLGGVTVRIPFAEAYNALDKGVVDAAMVPAELLKGFRVAEVTKYHTIMHLPTYSPGSLRAMNWDAYNRLPADIQKIIEDSSTWYTDTILKAKLETNDSGLEFAKKLNDEIITMAPEEYEKLYKLMDELGMETAAKLDAMGKPGTEIYKYTRQLIEEAKAK